MHKIAVIDFGGQYSHLIANRIRRLRAFSYLLEPQETLQPSDLKKDTVGIILSGGPHSVFADGSPQISKAMLDAGLPILGLCYGHQLLSHLSGGVVQRGDVSEFGRAKATFLPSDLFAGVQGSQQVWMSHGDSVTRLAPGFTTIATSVDCPVTAVENPLLKHYGLQFHPEVVDTPSGMQILSNFLDICNCSREWVAEEFTKSIAEQIIANTGDKKVFLLVSGGVASTVVFTLLNKTLGASRVVGLHVDTGLMRKNESNEIMAFLRKEGFENLHIVDAEELFLQKLKGVVDPEQKRIIIGDLFISVQKKAQRDLNLNDQDWLLAQGTIYPDTIESAGTKHADKIKTHHNRVDLIVKMINDGKVIEPISDLYKDEVRMLGEQLGIPHELVWRHPFPGPGLGVRVLCNSSLTDTRPDMPERVRKILSARSFQGCVLPVRSVGVQGDGRSYAYPMAVWGNFDWEQLEDVSTEITNNCRDINRVVFVLNPTGNPEFQLIEQSMTKQTLDLLREVDDKVTKVVRHHNEYDAIWQMPVVSLPLTDQQGKRVFVIRPIISTEAMTARFYPMSQEICKKIVSELSQISDVGTILYDVTHKPPATIEWE